MLEEESKRLMQEWEAHMSDFVPEDVSTIILEPRSEAVLLINILIRVSLDFLLRRWGRLYIHQRSLLRGG